VDVILDIVGGSHLEQNVKLLNPDGRLVTIGILGGAKGTLNLGLVLSKRLVITGSTLRARSPAEKQHIAAQLQQHVWPHIANGAIRPVVQAAFPLSEAAAAHTLLENNQASGKLVLIVDEKHASTRA
ncbi:MAG: zinc-binding dehydrogenase, partial [Gammaproteobacteria bacterium]|nr:zinc-binding dehydrogenase [Gammaproteobacteria bacterium]